MIRLVMTAALWLIAAPALAFDVTGDRGTRLSLTPLERFDAPWAMTFLPDGQALVTEKGGALWLTGPHGRKRGTIAGAPRVSARGQGGLGDVVLHPGFAANGLVYLSYVERDPANDSLSGAAILRARLVLEGSGGRLDSPEVIWRQAPKVSGNGHYGHRMAFAPDGSLYVTSGDRQKLTPAQDLGGTLGKVLRLNDDGTPAPGNPFATWGGVTAQVWTLGHRNPLGMDFDEQGRLWVHEMGPRGGDELNLIVRSENYGYPQVSEGSKYSGAPIPSHDTNPAFRPPAVFWNPSVSPAGFVIYDGALFGGWRGDGLLGGLSSRALVRVTFSGDTAREAERFEWGERIREVEQGADGALYLLEDGRGGRLLRAVPAGG